MKDSASSNILMMRRNEEVVPNSVEQNPSFLPPGFRFLPTDEELCQYYLRRKSMRVQCINLAIISDIDVYQYEPNELPEKSVLKNQDRVWYFFCAWKNKYKKGYRVNRATRNGFWKNAGKETEISFQSQTVGLKNTFHFYQGRAPSGERTEWLMQEFSLTEAELYKCGISSEDSYALCKIFKKSPLGHSSDVRNLCGPFVDKGWNGDSVVEDSKTNREKLVRLLNKNVVPMFSAYAGQVLPINPTVGDASNQPQIDHGLASGHHKSIGQLNERQKHAILSLKRNYDGMKAELARKRNEISCLASQEQVAVNMVSKLRKELQDAERELINSFYPYLINKSEIGINRPWHLNEEPFHKACSERFAVEEQELKAQELISMWKMKIYDPWWRPFKKVQIFGEAHETLDEEDERLKRLRHDWGEEVYRAVTTALVEYKLKKKCTMAKHLISDIWNFKENRKASVAETIHYILKEMHSASMNKRPRSSIDI